MPNCRTEMDVMERILVAENHHREVAEEKRKARLQSRRWSCWWQVRNVSLPLIQIQLDTVYSVYGFE